MLNTLYQFFDGDDDNDEGGEDGDNFDRDDPGKYYDYFLPRHLIT